MKRILHCRTLWLLALPALFATAPVAAGCTASSGAQSVALLELYTSQGCSSCPPADRWLRELSARSDSAVRVIPLALHVDYWDYIGWKDRYAQPKFAVRQREMAGLNRYASVYTPQFLLNGRDYRRWGNAARFDRDIAAINRTPARASIQLAISRSPADDIEVSVAAQASTPGKPLLYVALFENNLSSQVKAGENSGTRLHHERVVRAWLGPYPVDDKTTTPWPLKIPLQPEWKAQDLGVAAFVQSSSSGEVLQALALGLCDNRGKPRF